MIKFNDEQIKSMRDGYPPSEYDFEETITSLSYEVDELRKCLKVAEDALTELQTRLVASVYDGTINPYEALDITERALAAATRGRRQNER